MAIQQSTWRIILVFAIFMQSCGGDPVSTDEAEATMGKDLFSNNCVICHGSNGKLGASGAKDLSKSSLNPKEVRDVIMNGRGTMSSYSRIFEDDSVALNKLVDHVISLRK